MHDARAMRVVERLGQFDENLSRVLVWQPTLAPQATLERFAVHVAHDEEKQIPGLAERIQWDDVRMRKPGGGARFAQEPLACVACVRQFDREHLHCHLPIEERLSREIDSPHPAETDQLKQLVLRAKRRRECGGFRFQVFRRRRHVVEEERRRVSDPPPPSVVQTVRAPLPDTAYRWCS